VVFTLAQQKVDPVDNKIPVIAVISQPATTYNNKFPDAGNNWSEVVGSYVDWVQQTGAEVALIPYDMPWEVLTQVLAMTNGMVLPGGAAELVDFNNKNATTEYQNRIHSILKWAIQHNKKTYYPVWGTCLGFEEMVIHFAGNSGDALQNGFDDKAAYHKVDLRPAFKKSDFFSHLSVTQEMVENVFSRDIAYYYHSEGIAVDHFESMGLSKHLTLLGSSKNAAGKEFGAIFEAKNNIPMWFVQFHPEKHQFEKRESYKPMDRSELTIKVMSSFIFKLVNLARAHSKPLEEIPSTLQSYFPYYKTPIWSPSKAFERIYMFRNYFGIPKSVEKPPKSRLLRLLTSLKRNLGQADKALAH